VKTIEIPLFPGYVFCRPDLGAQMPIDAVPGVTGVVTFGARRAAVDHWELEAIRAVLTKGMVAQPWPFLKMGRKVAVERGPLKGVAGIIVRDKDLYRLVLSVTLLNSSIAVEIDRDWVSPMD
jgi:transcription antitermination factor NusG